METLSKKAKAVFNYYCDTSVRTPGQRALLLQGLRAFDQAEAAAAIIAGGVGCDFGAIRAHSSAHTPEGAKGSGGGDDQGF